MKKTKRPLTKMYVVPIEPGDEVQTLGERPFRYGPRIASVTRRTGKPFRVRSRRRRVGGVSGVGHGMGRRTRRRVR